MTWGSEKQNEAINEIKKLSYLARESIKDFVEIADESCPGDYGLKANGCCPNACLACWLEAIS